MNSKLRAVFALLTLALAGCRPSFVESTQTAVALNPPTPTIARAATPTAEAVSLPAADAMAAVRGQNVFNGMGACYSCHTTNGGRSLGPDLQGIAVRLAADGHDAAAYLRESIVDVLAVVPDGYRGDLMPQNYATTLTPEQIDDLVQFMLSL